MDHVRHTTLIRQLLLLQKKKRYLIADSTNFVQTLILRQFKIYMTIIAEYITDVKFWHLVGLAVSRNFVGCGGFSTLLSASHHGRDNVVQENLCWVLVTNSIASLAIPTKSNINILTWETNLFVYFVPLCGLFQI